MYESLVHPETPGNAQAETEKSASLTEQHAKAAALSQQHGTVATNDGSDFGLITHDNKLINS